MTMDALYGVRMVGPLAPHAQGFAEELTRLGFTTFSARGQLGMAMCLSRWLTGAGLDLAVLTDAAVDSFLAARRSAGYTAFLTPKALRPLLGYLRGLGVAPDAAPAATPKRGRGTAGPVSGLPARGTRRGGQGRRRL